MGKTAEEYKKTIDPRQLDYIENDIKVTKLFDFLQANNEMVAEGKAEAKKPAAKKTPAEKTEEKAPAAKKTTAAKTGESKPAAKKTTAKKTAE